MSSLFLRDMLVATRLGLHDLNRVIVTAPKRYKVYEIAKRSGGKRIIAHPSRELKILQYLVLERLLAQLPIHKAAAAYVSGRGIRVNAEAHLGKAYLIKLDFRDFFPSIKVSDWDKYVARRDCKILLDKEDAEAVRRILFWGRGNLTPNCLSIGAPTSPILSNILMYKFDAKVCKSLSASSVSYTRYADDITLSSDSLAAIRAAERSIEKIVTNQRWPRLLLNDEKRGFYTKGVKQMVTGLILTPEGRVSIGRERKRLIHAMVHNFIQGLLDRDNAKKLQGLIGFSIANEPQFIESLKLKYGRRAIRRIQQLT